MPEYIRTGTNKKTGQRVGMLADGTTVPLQQESVQSKPFQSPSLSEFMVPFKSTQRSKQLGMPFELNPDNPLINPMSLVPDSQLETAGAAGGAFVGSKIPVPFAATVGTGIGALMGQGEKQRRQFERGESVSKTSYASPAGYSALTLGGAGLVKGARALPFMKSSSAANASSKVFNRFQQLMGEATKNFGGQLDKLGIRVPTGQIVIQLRELASDPVQGKQIIRSLAGHDAKFGTSLRNLLDDMLDPPMDFTATQAQQLANALDDVAPYLSKSLKEGIFNSIPEAMGPMKMAYKQSMQDIATLGAGLGKSLFRASSKIGKAIKDPNFAQSAGRQIPEHVGTMKGLGARESVGEAVRWVKRAAPWIIGGKLAGEAFRNKD